MVGKTCICCDKAAAGPGRLCPACAQLFSGIPGTLCPRCSRRKGTCRCAQTSLYFASCVVLAYYEGLPRQMVLGLKGRGYDRTAKVLAEFLARRIARDERYRQIDLVVWVPKFIGDYLKNGINAAQMLAVQTARQLQLPSKKFVLIKKRKTGKQTRLSYLEREENLRDAFAALRPGQIRDKKILLIDDVITTGSTMSECAKALYYAGAREVVAAAVCGTKIGTK